MEGFLISGDYSVSMVFSCFTGCIPPLGGMREFPTEARISPEESTIPIPVFSAVPSIPMQIIQHNTLNNYFKKFKKIEI